jgi:hypothetical protein
VTTLRWTLSVLFGLPAGLLILLNWIDLIRWTRAHKAGESLSFAPPFLCGMVGAAACLLCPVSQVQFFAWCPLLLDPSIFGGIIFFRFVRLLRKYRSRNGRHSA